MRENEKTKKEAERGAEWGEERGMEGRALPELPLRVSSGGGGGVREREKEEGFLREGQRWRCAS